MRESFFGFLVWLAFGSLVLSLASLIHMTFRLSGSVALALAFFGAVMVWFGFLFAVMRLQDRKK